MCTAWSLELSLELRVRAVGFARGLRMSELAVWGGFGFEDARIALALQVPTIQGPRGSRTLYSRYLEG